MLVDIQVHLQRADSALIFQLRHFMVALSNFLLGVAHKNNDAIEVAAQEMILVVVVEITVVVVVVVVVVVLFVVVVLI